MFTLATYACLVRVTSETLLSAIFIDREEKWNRHRQQLTLIIPFLIMRQSNCRQACQITKLWKLHAHLIGGFQIMEDLEQ